MTGATATTTFDIGYALKRAGLKLPIERCRMIAAHVVAHLRLARWQFALREPSARGSAARPAHPRVNSVRSTSSGVDPRLFSFLQLGGD